MCSGSSGGGLPQGVKNFSGGPTMGTQPVQTMASTPLKPPVDDTQMGGTRMPPIQTPTANPNQMTGGGEPMATYGQGMTLEEMQGGGTRLPPIIPPGPYNPSEPISSQPGGNGWGPQTPTGPSASGRGFGHSYVNPYPGMNGAQRNAAMTAEIEQEMAANHAARLAQRQQNQANRGGNFENGVGPGNRMEQMFGNNEGYQRLQGTFQQKPGTLPYGIPTDPAAQQAFIQAGNFTPDQVRTLRQMGQQVGNINTQGMAPQIQNAQQQNLGLLNTATQGYAPSQGMNPFFTVPR